MGKYEEIVISALENGPRPRYGLVEELCPREMSKKKLQSTLNSLEDEGRIICRPQRIGKTHKWTSVYALPKHRHLLQVDYGQVAKAVEHLRLELCRNPDVEEVAAKISKDPSDVRRVVYQHAEELNWKPPTPADMSEAEKSQKKAREAAALVKYSRENYIPEKASRVELRCGEFLLEHRFKSIVEDDMPFLTAGVVNGFYIGPPEPKERNKKEALETIRRLITDAM